jgi:Tfp pilus assembly protein PilF
MIGNLTRIAFCAGVLTAATSVLAFAFDAPQPGAGVIHTGSTPCMLAKYNKKPECPLPSLAEGADAIQQVKARLDRTSYYIDMAQLKDALVEADEALKLAPADVDIRHLVARLALSVGDHERAEQEIKTALQERPDDPDLQATNAARFMYAPRPDEALRLFSQIISAHPDHRFSRESRGRLLMTLGRSKEAVADFDTLLAGKERDTNLLALRADAHIGAGDFQQAVTDLTDALSQAPRRYDLLTRRAIANESLGDDNAALVDFNSILGPLDGSPHYAIGGNELMQYKMQRAFVLVHLKRFSDAATDAVSALNIAGRQSLLQAQIFLRHNGFPDVPLDGQSSENLKRAMQACMGLNSCFEKVIGPL